MLDVTTLLGYASEEILRSCVALDEAACSPWMLEDRAAWIFNSLSELHIVHECWWNATPVHACVHGCCELTCINRYRQKRGFRVPVISYTRSGSRENACFDHRWYVRYCRIILGRKDFEIEAKGNEWIILKRIFTFFWGIFILKCDIFSPLSGY